MTFSSERINRYGVAAKNHRLVLNFAMFCTDFISINPPCLGVAAMQPGEVYAGKFGTVQMKIIEKNDIDIKKRVFVIQNGYKASIYAVFGVFGHLNILKQLLNKYIAIT